MINYIPRIPLPLDYFNITGNEYVDEPSDIWISNEEWNLYEETKLKNKFCKDILLLDISDLYYYTPFTSNKIKDRWFPTSLFGIEWYNNVTKTEFTNMLIEMLLSSTKALDTLLVVINQYIYQWITKGLLKAKSEKSIVSYKFNLYNYIILLNKELLDIIEKYNIGKVVGDIYPNYTIPDTKFCRVANIDYNNLDSIVCELYVYRRIYEINIH